MKDAQKPDHVSLNTLIGWLKEGRFVIPDFQREFEWEPWDIRELMRSIFLDYYIGSLLLWKGKKDNFEALSCEPIYGYRGKGDPQEIVLDGQQRLTAIYYVFCAPDVPLPNRANRYFYYIQVDKFMAEEYDEAFNYDWTQRWPKLLEDKEAQYSGHVFPLAVVGMGGWELGNWVQEYQRYWETRGREAEAAGMTAESEAAREHAENAKAFGHHLKGITEQYQISYIELDQELAVDKVCDIFTQVNSKGVRLDVFDLINALLKPKGLQLKHMWREAAPKLEFVETERMNVYILQVMSLIRQSYCSPKYLYYLLPGQERPVRDPDGTRRKEVLVPDIRDFEKRWKDAVAALSGAIKLLRDAREFGAIKSDYLPYVSILPAFAALQAHVGSLPPERKLDAKRKVRHWYWASVFTNRYSGSVESTSARDFLDVKAWIETDEAAPPLLLEFQNRFKNLDLRREVRRGTSVYNGIFNLLVLTGARDWMTGDAPQHDDLDDHHIVPLSWGTRHLPVNAVHTILNRTPLTADTNRNVIRERLPNQYLPDLINANGKAAVRAILDSHLISEAAEEILLRDPFTPDDFEAFIAERQRTIQDAIENLLIKERMDLPPHLRELDERIERIELGLRGIIGESLNGDSRQLPPGVAEKVEERIQKASQRNAAMSVERYQTLAGKLEYCDLRELQAVITNGGLWQLFQPRFLQKEALDQKFSQLAELRNGIRHSRTVDQVTRMEGEAATIWFEQVLGN